MPTGKSGKGRKGKKRDRKKRSPADLFFFSFLPSLLLAFLFPFLVLAWVTGNGGLSAGRGLEVVAIEGGRGGFYGYKVLPVTTGKVPRVPPQSALLQSQSGLPTTPGTPIKDRARGPEAQRPRDWRRLERTCLRGLSPC